ncbi:MAG: glycosyltransferase family 2 protein [Phycisphaerales bacterium]
MRTLHVVIPFYNEPDTIQPCVRRVVDARLGERWRKQLVIVDDYSDERCRILLDSLVRQLREEGCEVALHRHDVNRGKGAAVSTGFDAVLDAHPPDDDLVIIQDADLEYDPADYAQLIEPIIRDEAQAVVGVRWGGHHPTRGFRPRIHRWGNGLLTMCSNLMTGYRVHDMECCYKVFGVGLLCRLRPWLSEPRFGIEPQIMAGLSRIGATVAEVPVSYDPRSITAGKKIGWIDGLQAVRVIVRERFRSTTTPSAGSNESEARRG